MPKRGASGRPSAWCVYRLSMKTVHGRPRWYVGMTGLQGNEGHKEAAKRRLVAHQAGPEKGGAVWCSMGYEMKVEDSFAVTKDPEAHELEAFLRCWSAAPWGWGGVAGRSEHSFCCRGACFPMVHIKPEMQDVIGKIRTMPLNELKVQGPKCHERVKQHLSGACFVCGKKGHYARSCSKQEALRREEEHLFVHNPARYSHPGGPLRRDGLCWLSLALGCSRAVGGSRVGPYWHKNREQWSLLVKDKKSPDRKPKRISARVKEEGGAWYVYHAECCDGPLPDKATAVIVALTLVQCAGAAAGWDWEEQRRYEWQEGGGRGKKRTAPVSR